MAHEPDSGGRPPPLPPGAIQPADELPSAPTGGIAPGMPPAHEIALPHAPAAPAPQAKASAKAPQQHDSFREFIETIVFVVVLVLILKTFLAEAFVIPTGSMATTLLGYHKNVRCQQCDYHFLVNASKEADPAERERQDVTACTCPKCFFVNELKPRFPQGALP